MSIKKLEKNIDEILDNFCSEITANYTDGSKEPATEGDIAELARQTFYAMQGFKKEIIDYLKTK